MTSETRTGTGKRARIIILALAVAVVVAGAGILSYRFLSDDSAAPADGTGADQTGLLASALPEPLWSSIATGYVFEPTATDRVRAMNSDLLATFPDDIALSWWVFSHPGSIEDALEALAIPADATVTSPYSAAASDVGASHLILWEDLLLESRGSAWLDDARVKAAAWEGVDQHLAEVRFVVNDGREAPDLAAADRTDLVSWSLMLASPILDLEDFTLIEGTFLVIGRLDYSY